VWEWYALSHRLELSPFLGAVGLFLLSFVGIAISLWPFIVPYQCTLSRAASSPSTQAFLLIGPRRGREGRGVERGERMLGLIEAADQEEAPDLESPRMRGIHAVAVRFERRPRRVERLRRLPQVA